MYDSAIGVALANDDVVDALVATTGWPVSVVLRLPSHDVGNGVILWARCGAPPTSTAYDRKVWTNVDGGAFFQMTPCPSGQTLHVSVTNTSNRPRAFRLYVASHHQEWSGLKVGVAWNASTAEMNDIRTAMRRAAWQFFGLTGGAGVIRSFRYYHNASACDDGWPADEYACSGGGCQVCLSPGTGQNWYNGLGKITLYANGGGNAAGWMQGGNVIVHEFGHAYMSLPDEYVDLPSPNSFSGCAHTHMSLYADNAFMLCTNGTHRATGLSFPFQRSHQGPLNVNPSGVVYQVSHARSNWQELWEDGNLVVPFPHAQQTQESIRMREFFSSTILGRCDLGC